ncbi:mitochondrial carrier domain-containing protein [Dipodascopsis tothii]|uniref:mitochondrial carrier domain-containing protein n=1 Tax=Dipodascopsis tothii TaxID=44089 RepID=UPI0034CDAE87
MDLETIAAGAAGAVVSSLVFHPIDTVLTLQQTSVSNSLVLPLRQYWKGISVTTTLTAAAFATYVASYRECKAVLTPYVGADSAANYVGAGIVSELVSSLFWTPMDVVKGRMQVHLGSERTRDVVRAIWRHEGLPGFFRGYWLSLAVYVPHSAIYWLVYERAKERLRTWPWPWADPEDLTTGQYAVASGTALAAAETASNFFDLVKTRQQLAFSAEVKAMRPDDRAGWATVTRNVVRELGWRSLVRGLPLRLAYGLPSGVLSMVIVETVRPDHGPDVADILDI